MQFGGVLIPDALLEATLSGDLVIFAGAGVSASEPVELPLFNDLVDKIKTAVDSGGFLRERECKFDKEGDVIYIETPEQYLSFLEHEGQDVRKACSSLVNPCGNYNNIHANIIKTFNVDSCVRLVTTNFDNCFESALDEMGRKCKYYSSPALPLGKNVDGIVHLHGIYNEKESMIVTAEDYGNAYVSNGWISRFLVDLFKSYTVLFVGYSCNDSLVDYLTRSISSEISGHSFVLCKESDVDNWRMRGVEPIVFVDFDELPKVFEDLSAFSESSLTDKVIRLQNVCRLKEKSQDDRELITSLLKYPDEEDRYIFTFEFCRNSKCVADLQLLKSNGLASFLTSAKLFREESALLDWSIKEFAVGEIHAFQEFCVEFIDELSPSFYTNLFWRLATSDVPESIIGSWLPWLESANYLTQRQCEYHLVEIAKRTKSHSIFLAIIRILLRVNICASHSTFLGLAAEATTVATSDYHVKDLLPIVSETSASIRQSIFEFCFNQIERAYSIETNCGTKTDYFDGLSYGRSSIAPHEQDVFCSGIEGILIDIARDSVDKSFCISAVQKCVSSKYALLIRLGLWIKCEYNCSGSDLAFIEENELLSNHYLRHEVFALLKKAFQLASPEQRDSFIQYISSRLIEGDPHSEYDCYNICVWLLDDDQAYPALEELQKSITARNPDFAPREHPDVTHYMSSGFVNDSDQCRIPIEDFTSEKLLASINLSTSSYSLISKYDLVSVPSRDYPMQAIVNLNGLLDKTCSSGELELMNSYVISIEWGNIDVPKNIQFETICRVLSDERTCVAGIKAVDNFASGTNCVFSYSELAVFAEKALPHFGMLISSESAINLNENPDWVFMAINQPAGKYIELLAEADRLCLNKEDAHSQVIRTCFEKVCELLTERSDGARYVIACIFVRFNLFQELCPRCFSEKLIYALQSDNWAFASAWEGLSYAPRLTKNAWALTKNTWPQLFRNSNLIRNSQFGQLIRLYVWSIIVMAETDERISLLNSCASSSRDALRAACQQLDNWLETLEDERRLEVWNEWLSGSFETLASIVVGGEDVLAEFYCRWLREFPRMRTDIAGAILRDCQEVDSRDLFVFDETLSSIAADCHLTDNDKAILLTFLLEHQKNFFYEEDARNAVKHIDPKKVDRAILRNIKDAFTRKGLIDAVSEWEASAEND